MPDLIFWPENYDSEQLIEGDIQCELWSYGEDFMTLLIKEEDKQGAKKLKLSISERDAFFIYKFIESILNSKAELL